MWNGRRKGVKLTRFIISFTMILSLFITGSLRDYGPIVAHAVEESGITYVSDVRLFYAVESLDKAKEKCIDSGFIPVEGDLNAGTDRNHVCMGYKTTPNKEEAITSIKTLSMQSGYDLKDYEELQKKYKDSNSAIIDTIDAAAQEFVVNYEAGSPKAALAYQGLNLINVPEEDEMKLGDYIVTGKADWNFFAEVVARSSAGTVSAIVGYLSEGLAAYNNGYDEEKGEEVTLSWADQVSESNVWDQLEEATTQDEFDELYREYGDDAKALHEQLQDFATAYDNAVAVFNESKAEEELSALEGQSEESVVTDMDEVSENNQHMMYIAMYDELETYKANEDYNLGEYLLNLGYETSGEVDLTQLYPVIDSMSYAQRRMSAVGGVNSLIISAGENEEDPEAEEKLSEAAEHIKELIGSDSYSVWMNDNEELKGKKVAYTNDAIRSNAAQQLIDKQEVSTWKEDAEEIMKWVNLGLGVLFCVVLVAQFSAFATILAAIPAAICALAAACGLTSTAITIGVITKGIVAGASTLASPVGLITLGVLLISMLVIWVVSEVKKYIKENKDYDYEDAPEYVADEAKGDKGKYLVYYKGVGSEEADEGDDYHGNEWISDVNGRIYHGNEGISDVNGRMGFRGWNCMFISRDLNVGSPIIVNEGEDAFFVKHGDDGTNPINGYDCVKAFGEIMPVNLNSLMKKDEYGGIYVHYRTEKSILNNSGSSDPDAGVVSGPGADVGNDDTGSSDTVNPNLYYEDIIVRSADTEALAKAKITAKGFQIWDKNLANDARFKYSRHKEWAYTYLGFKTTNNPKEAITDIRVATFTPATTNDGKLFFGDINYGCAGNLGYKAENKDEAKEYPADLDGLWFTKHTKAGTPIHLGALHLVDSHEDGKYVDQGWIPVTTFSGVPYNFASTRDFDTDSAKPGRQGNYGFRYTCYGTNEDDKWDCPARYLYYEPEVKYTSGTKYLSSVFFTFGSDSESTAAKVGETTAKYTQLVDRMKQTPNTVILSDNNLASSFYYKGFIVESNQKYLNIGYSWSYSPYRALTDIKVFQGSTFSTELPYSISKSICAGSENKNVTYDAVTVISQRTATATGWVLRGIGPENTFMGPNGLLGTNTQVTKGYTSYQPGGYAYARDKMPFISTGLYVSGPTDAHEKLTLNDVIISGNKHDATDDGGVITADVSGESTLSGESATGEFNSIQEMKRPFETEPFNIAYPEWTNDNGEKMEAATPCYIYIRKAARKRKYISKLFVGTYSFSKSGQKEDINTNQAIAKVTDMYATIEAVGSATDEVIPANAAIVSGRTWYGALTEKLMDKYGGAYDDGTTNDATLPGAPPSAEFTPDGNQGGGGAPTERHNFTDRPASYISVERTDDPEKAIKGILLYKTDVDSAPEKIQVDGVDYHCSSIHTPIEMQQWNCDEDEVKDALSYRWKKQKYYLYYTYNRGVTPGQPITEITIDENVFNTKQATALCVDKTDKVARSADGRKSVGERAITYGEAALPTFIHMIYEKGANTYFNRIYTAGGSTKKEALAGLLGQGCTEFIDMNLNEGVSLTKEDKEQDENKQGGEYIYFGYRGYTVNEKASASEREEQRSEAVYDIICTKGEPYHPDGIQTDRWQMYYAPVTRTDKDGTTTGTNLNAGTNGPAIYMYYTTPWLVEQYNKSVGTDARKDVSPDPKTYLKSPLVRLCLTRYGRVPYNKESGADASFGDDIRPWEYILYDDSKTPVDMNDGTVKLDANLYTENNQIMMFAQREDGSEKKSAEITGGFVSGELEVGQMWLNK